MNVPADWCQRLGPWVVNPFFCTPRVLVRAQYEAKTGQLKVVLKQADVSLAQLDSENKFWAVFFLDPSPITQETKIRHGRLVPAEDAPIRHGQGHMARKSLILRPVPMPDHTRQDQKQDGGATKAPSAGKSNVAVPANAHANAHANAKPDALSLEGSRWSCSGYLPVKGVTATVRFDPYEGFVRLLCTNKRVNVECSLRYCPDPARERNPRVETKTVTPPPPPKTHPLDSKEKDPATNATRIPFPAMVCSLKKTKSTAVSPSQLLLGPHAVNCGSGNVYRIDKEIPFPANDSAFANPFRPSAEEKKVIANKDLPPSVRTTAARKARRRVIRLFLAHIQDKMEHESDKYNLGELVGKQLFCWCAPDWCHCDALVFLMETVFGEQLSPRSLDLLHFLEQED
jgi:hypothetical protein